jgi:very-short-patch-repair endonuclease
MELTPAQQIAKAQAKAKRESLELAFAAHCLMSGLAPKRQFKLPHLPYVWDFAFPESLLLIEVNGGTWTKGTKQYMEKSGHNSPAGIQRDYTKANAAALAGWWQLTFTADDVKSGRAIADVKRFLTAQIPF